MANKTLHQSFTNLIIWDESLKPCSDILSEIIHGMTKKEFNTLIGNWTAEFEINQNAKYYAHDIIFHPDKKCRDSDLKFEYKNRSLYLNAELFADLVPESALSDDEKREKKTFIISLLQGLYVKPKADPNIQGQIKDCYCATIAWN